MAYILGIIGFVVVFMTSLVWQGSIFSELMARNPLRNWMTGQSMTPVNSDETNQANIASDYLKIDLFFKKSANDLLKSDALTDEQREALSRAKKAFEQTKSSLNTLEQYKDNIIEIKNFLEKFVVSENTATPPSSSQVFSPTLSPEQDSAP